MTRLFELELNDDYIGPLKTAEEKYRAENKIVLTAKEVEVSAERRKNIESTKVSQIKLDVQKVKQMPAIMGEVDILKTIQCLSPQRSTFRCNFQRAPLG